ncbi:MAG: hypothetical protein AAGE86_04525 [Pseudomonadota bacterium]
MVDCGGIGVDWRDAYRTDVGVSTTNGCFHPTGVYAILSCMNLAVAVILILGVGNFALHRAVLESDHPMIGQMPSFVHSLGGRLSLVAEFLVLLAASLLAANGWPMLAWAYAGYSALNALAAWLILTGRV